MRNKSTGVAPKARKALGPIEIYFIYDSDNVMLTDTKLISLCLLYVNHIAKGMFRETDHLIRKLVF